MSTKLDQVLGVETDTEQLGAFAPGTPVSALVDYDELDATFRQNPAETPVVPEVAAGRVLQDCRRVRRHTILQHLRPRW